MIFTTERVRELRQECEALVNGLSKAKEYVGRSPKSWARQHTAQRLKQVLEFATDVAPVIPLIVPAGGITDADASRLIDECILGLEAMIDASNEELDAHATSASFDARSWAGMVAGMLLATSSYGHKDYDVPTDWLEAISLPDA